MSEELLTRDAILNIDDVRIEKVVVKEWGGKVVYCRSMSGPDRASLLKEHNDPDHDDATGPAHMAARVLCDPQTGERLFEDKDWERLWAKNAKAMDEISKLGLKLAGMSEEEQEELRGESEEAPS